MVYNRSGTQLQTVYSESGTTLSNGYSTDGAKIFPTVEAYLKSMTYNAQWFSKLNSQQAMQEIIIGGNNADIIGFQEISKTGQIPDVGLAVLTNYPVKRLSNHTNYIAMASKRRFTNVVVKDFTSQDPEEWTRWGETRAYMVSDMMIAGDTVKWINTHLAALGASYKFAQMGEVFALAQAYRAQGYPVIITGDFNSWADDAADDEYIYMYKQFVDAGYNLANNTPTLGFTKTWTDSTTATSTAQMTYAADNIIVSPEFSISTIKFDATKFSWLDGNPIDHIPIIVSLAYGGVL